MAQSYVKYTADGSTPNFSLTFAYLKKDHVSVEKNGATAAFTWLSPLVITVTGGVVNGDEIVVRRTTPKETLANPYDGSVLTYSVLRTLALQSIYLSEESQDIANDANLTTTEAAELIASAVSEVEVYRDQANVSATAADASADAAAATAAAVTANATTIATAAATAATTQAEDYRDDASASAAAAAASAAACAAAFDNFDDRFLGSKSSAPTLDNDGNNLTLGALYYDTSLTVMRWWNGSTWTSIQPGVTQADGDLRYIQQAGSISNAASIWDTGDTKQTFRSGTAPTGWLYLNGKSIGSASSGATARANSDVQPLYLFCWAAFSNTISPVVGGRGASAAADWAANKALALPNAAGCVFASLDNLGGITSVNKLNSYVSSTILGATGGAQAVNTQGTDSGPVGVRNDTQNISVSQGSHVHATSTVQPTMMINTLIKM